MKIFILSNKAWLAVHAQNFRFCLGQPSPYASIYKNPLYFRKTYFDMQGDIYIFYKIPSADITNIFVNCHKGNVAATTYLQQTSST